MTTASTIKRDPAPNLASRAASSLTALLRAYPILPAILIVAMVVAVRALGTVESDVAWQLWIAHQLNHGAHLYRDIIDTNPPLWFWMAVPLDWLSALVHVRSDHLLIFLIGAAAALSLVATDRLLSSISPQRRSLLLAYAALVLVAMPWRDVGQRDHVSLIATLPYAALIAARRTKRAVPVGLAVAIGLGAGLGFALKPYFLLVPLLLEIWLLSGMRKNWRLVRLEAVAMASVGVSYAVAMLLVGRDFFSIALPVITLAYGATGAKHVLDLFQPAVIVALASIILLVSKPSILRSDPAGIGGALTVAAVSFAIAYFIQAKGWNYHAVPLLGCAVIAFAACLVAGAKPPPLMALAAPALLFLPFTIAAQQAMREPPSARDVERAVRGMHEGDSVGFIGTDPSLGWYVTLQRGFRFPSRHNGFWMMHAIVRNEAIGGIDPRLTELGRRIVREAVADFKCTPPKRIIVARPTTAAARAGEFDILAFFLRDPEFARLLAHYRPIERTSVEVYQLELPLQRARDCPSWSPA
jgi:hypothetical protein